MDDLLIRYNYDTFAPEKFEPWMNFEASPKTGSRGLDFPLWDLDRMPTRLSDIWSQHDFTVENAIQYFAQIPKRRRAGERLAPFHVERLDYRNQERDQFYKRLERNGPKAVEEFCKAFPNG